ncbi:S8 family peptidase [Thermoflavimicrobium dichotomicum]|uniref:Subtilase family protein n=1 Tax=Thermoflavimicrobium dichotomicum TaxID=46223 RepID=A0A1I3MT84_9BACL|nr:S8 family peptidase [Thermoflavimicrobium dichotomicum]SFI99916.1 Subtilase family protein [Thermoflavimicrobium dichotomicum]
MIHINKYLSRNRKERPIRRIFCLKQGSHFKRCLNEMLSLGIRPVKYLAHLRMVVGEYIPHHSNHWEAHPDVEYMEPDLQIKITEPYLGSITSFQPTLPWGVKRIQAPNVWKITQGKNVRIAVVDTGIYSEHPAVKNNYKGGINVISPYFPPHDYNGHGTHVAGIIAGMASELGVIGVAPRAHIYAVKAFNRKGNANLSDLLTAINWCIENKMQIINMSFGMDKMSDVFRLAIQTAHQKGIVMVAAAGNRGLATQIDYPARYPETIGVTSIGNNDRISVFSNRGKGIDLAAPGEKIPSSWLNNSVREMSGTSMAVPHVVGVAALLLFMRHQLNPEQIRYLLTKSSKKIDGEIGIVNAYQAVRLLK